MMLRGQIPKSRKRDGLVAVLHLNSPDRRGQPDTSTSSNATLFDFRITGHPDNVPVLAQPAGQEALLCRPRFRLFPCQGQCPSRCRCVLHPTHLRCWVVALRSICLSPLPLASCQTCEECLRAVKQAITVRTVLQAKGGGDSLPYP